MQIVARLKSGSINASLYERRRILWKLNDIEFMLNNDIRNVIGELADSRDEETIFLDLKQKFRNIISKR